MLLEKYALGVDVFTDHVVRHHKGIIPLETQINRPFWQDWILYNNDYMEEDFCYSLSELNN